MKRLLKISGLIIAFLLLLMLALPFFFKDKIAEMAKEEINKNVNATVDFRDFSLSLFRSFPDFSFGLKGFSVVGKDAFQGDTLAFVNKIYLDLDLMSVFSGDGYEIKSIVIKDPYINTVILKNGKANYDIAKEGEESADTQEEESGEESAFVMKLKKFEIDDATVIYDDREGNMYARIKDLDLILGGNFTASTTDIKLKSEIDELTYRMDGINYLNKTKVVFDALIAADFDKSKYSFKDNNLKLNDLGLHFDGSVAMPGDDILTDLKFASDKAGFKSILSLVPAIYLTDFEDLKTSGNAAVSGFVKGTYNEKTMPAFAVDINVDNGMFQYPDLPQKVEYVNIKANINSPSDDMDDMVIDVKKFHFAMAGNPFDIRLKLKHPLTDPDIDAAFKGKMDLATVEKFYPMDDDMKLSGKFAVDFSLKGKQSYLDKGYYSKFESSGFMKINNLNYSDKDLPEGVKIENAEMNFSPRYIALDNFVADYQGSKIDLTGKLSNYFDYFFGDGTLKGNMTMKSDYINLNKMLAADGESAGAETTEQTTEENEEEPLEAFEVPDNIDFTFQTFIGRIKYEKLDINTIYGKMTLADSRVSLDDMNMEMLGGKLNLNGFYSSLNIDSPAVSMLLGIKDFNIKKSYDAFNTVRILAPLSQYIDGTFSALLTYDSKLDKEMNPVFNTLNSEGMIKTSALSIKGSPLFSRIAKQLKYDRFADLQTKAAMLKYKIEDGNLAVEPFDIVIDDIPATVSGTTNLDRSIDYDIAMEIPKSKLGSQANAMLNSLTAKAKAAGVSVDNSETIPVNVFVSGKANDPKVKVKVKNPAQDAQKQIEDAVKQEIDKAKKQAQEEAEKLKKQAEDELNKAKKQAQDSINNVLNRQKQELEKKKKELEKKKKEAEEKAKKKLEEEAKKKLKGFF